MKPPLFVRPLTDSERDALTAGWRSPDAFTLRRCQVLLASARGARAPQIATHLGCDDQTVRSAIDAFNRSGLDVLTAGSSRPQRIAVAFDPVAAARLRTPLHQSPRAFGEATSIWALDLAAAVCAAEGITDARVTGETIRATLRRLGIRRQRAKQRITGPDPAYARKKGDAIG